MGEHIGCAYRRYKAKRKLESFMTGKMKDPALEGKDENKVWRILERFAFAD